MKLINKKDDIVIFFQLIHERFHTLFKLTPIFSSIIGLQAEYGESTNWTFNCLALGAVQTEMLEEAFPGYQAPVYPEQMAEYIKHFTLNNHKVMRGRVVEVSLSTP